MKFSGGYLMLDLAPDTSWNADSQEAIKGKIKNATYEQFTKTINEGVAIIIPQLEISSGGNVYHLLSIHPTVEKSFISGQEYNATYTMRVSCGSPRETFIFELSSDGVITMTKEAVARKAVK